MLITLLIAAQLQTAQPNGINMGVTSLYSSIEVQPALGHNVYQPTRPIQVTKVMGEFQPTVRYGTLQRANTVYSLQGNED